MLQASLYQKGLELTRLKVLSTTTSVPLASSGTCSQGSINGICIGRTQTQSPQFSSYSPACSVICMHEIRRLQMCLQTVYIYGLG